VGTPRCNIHQGAEFAVLTDLMRLSAAPSRFPRGCDGSADVLDVSARQARLSASSKATQASMAHFTRAV
jgi:hypothetical protein